MLKVDKILAKNLLSQSVHSRKNDATSNNATTTIIWVFAICKMLCAHCLLNPHNNPMKEIQLSQFYWSSERLNNLPKFTWSHGKKDIYYFTCLHLLFFFFFQSQPLSSEDLVFKIALSLMCACTHAHTPTHTQTMCFYWASHRTVHSWSCDTNQTNQSSLVSSNWN